MTWYLLQQLTGTDIVQGKTLHYIHPPVEIPGGASTGFIMHDDLATKGYEECTIVASRSTEIFPFRSSRFKC